MKLITNIVGINFRGKEVSQIVRDELKPGMLVFFEAEPTNEYDANAVRVLFDPPNADRLFIGYVPKTDNFEIAQTLAAEGEVTGEVLEVGGKWPRISIEYDNVHDDELETEEESDEEDDE